MSDKKNLWMILAGVGAIAAAALIYQAFREKGDEEDEDEDTIDMETLKESGISDVQRAGNLLESRYFLKLL